MTMDDSKYYKSVSEAARLETEELGVSVRTLRMAYHEASHATVAARYDYVVEEIVLRETGGGYTKMYCGCDWDCSCADDAETLSIITLAGLAGEAQYGGYDAEYSIASNGCFDMLEVMEFWLGAGIRCLESGGKLGITLTEWVEDFSIIAEYILQERSDVLRALAHELAVSRIIDGARFHEAYVPRINPDDDEVAA